MDAGSVGRWLIKEAQCARKGEIRVLDAESCSWNFLKFGLYEDGCGACGARQGCVAGISDEGDLSGSGFLNAFDAGYFDFRVATEFRA